MNKTTSLKTFSAVALGLTFSAVASHAALTTTFVGGGGGSTTGDVTSGVGSFTVTDNDTTGGDLWNGGDTFTYLHESTQVSNSFTATVRVTGQTAEANGRWGKGGINVRSSLDAGASNAMAQVAVGNGSQVAAPTNGDAHDPVPIRLSGRTNNDGTGGFEDAVVGPVGNPDGLILDVNGDVASNVFAEGVGTGANVSWLSISWDSVTNEFIAGFAPDIAGAPGTWAFSATRNNVASDGDWYVGVGYSAHGDLNFGASDPRGEGEHGLVFDNFSLVVVPEPSTSLLGVGALALLALRRRR